MADYAIVGMSRRGHLSSLGVEEHGSGFTGRSPFLEKNMNARQIYNIHEHHALHQPQILLRRVRTRQ